MIIPSRLCRAVCLALVALTATTLHAQSSKVAATLDGTVKDSTGALIPLARVDLRHLDTNQARALTTDDNGFFRATELAVGTYEVRVRQEGFAPYLHTGVLLTIGQTVHLDVVLSPAALSAEIVVTDQPPAIDASQTTLTTTIDQERILELPVRSRNYLNFVLLAPGVSASAPTGAPGRPTVIPDSGFTFGGLRPRSNNLSIDGLDNNDAYSGSSRTELSLEMVREFEVVNNGFSAESGGASGGSINVVSRTGSNVCHGEVFVFEQDGALNARPPLADIGEGPSELSRQRVGFSLGGPIVKDRTFFYVSGEQERLRDTEESEIDRETRTAVNSALAGGAWPTLATRRLASGRFPVSGAESEFAAKLNHQLSASHSLMLRYAYTNNREASDAFHTSGLTDWSARGSRFTRDHALVGSLVSLARGGRAVNDLRFQIATRHVVERTGDAVGPGVDIAGVALFGRPYEGNGTRSDTQYQVGDTVSWSVRAHLFKIGMSLNQVRLRSAISDGFGGLYSFASVADFVAGRFDSYRKATGASGTAFNVTSLGAFVQDHWQPRRGLTVDIGLRYDLEALSSPFATDTNNLSPRLGLAYSPSSRWVLRAGYGLFYDRYVLGFLNPALQKDGLHADERILDAGQAQALPSIFRADPTLRAASSQQASLAAEYLLTRDTTATISSLFVTGSHLARTRNVNLVEPDDSGVFGSARLNRSYDDVFQIEDSARSRYQGVTLTVNRRFINEFAILASYTYSRTRDDASDFNEQPMNPLRPQDDWALSRQHQAHRFVLSSLFEMFEDESLEHPDAPKKPPASGPARWLGFVFHNIEMAPIVTITSGRPVDPLTGVDSGRTHAYPFVSRPAGLARNSLATPGLFTVNWRAVRYFMIGRGRLDMEFEFFNLLNHRNVTEINPVYGSGRDPLTGYGRTLSAANGRQVQFALDFEF